MKTKIIPVLLGVFVFLGFGGLLSQQNPEDAKFAKTMETFLDEYWKFYPTAATLAGYTKYNDRLEDLSESAIEKRGTALDGYSKDLVTKINKDKLSPDVQIDRDLLMDAIDLELLRLDNLVPQQYNPIFYNDIILQSIRSLLVREFGPIEARMKSAAERAKQLPGFLKQAKENLKTPPKEYTEAAIKQFSALLEFYKTEVPKLIENVSSEAKTKFLAELAKVIPALEDYQRFLQGDLLNRSTGNFRLGPDAHARLLRLTCQGNLMINDVLANAKADSNNIRRDMNLIAMPYYGIMYPNQNMEQLSVQYKDKVDQLRTIFIKGVLDKIKGEHPTKENFLDRIKASVDEIKAFLGQSKMLDMPQENLAVEPMPAAEGGEIWVRLLSPYPYEPSGRYRAQVSPIPDDWSADQVQGFLEEYNNYLLPIWTIEKVYPGQFFPIFYTRNNPSLIRRLHPNEPLIRGWALYSEEMFINAGFGNYDLKIRLNQLKMKLKAVIDFQLEISVHQFGLAKDEAMRLMTITGLRTQAEAERRWNMIVLHPCEAGYPYIGYQEILDMEKDYKKLKGDAFSQKEFLQKLLSYGAIPPRALKAKLSQ
ncbi:MAG: DUF885 domain-containing protein [Candidatus Aminicenantes bacterium]|nr:DUF885 domain-containing protein [Candidatus Aminicenantes bacterium]